MGRPTTKHDLIIAANENYKRLNALINSMTEEELSIPFSFEEDDKKKEAHWNRDKNLRDTIVHLYEWHQLILNWITSNMNGDEKTFLPAPYTWKTYGNMNVEFWKKHQQTTLDEAKIMLIKSHEDVMKLAENFSNEELFFKDVYKWVGGSTLGSYFISVTSGHYDWAIKKLKAHIKNCKS